VPGVMDSTFSSEEPPPRAALREAAGPPSLGQAAQGVSRRAPHVAVAILEVRHRLPKGAADEVPTCMRYSTCRKQPCC